MLPSHGEVLRMRQPQSTVTVDICRDDTRRRNSLFRSGYRAANRTPRSDGWSFPGDVIHMQHICRTEIFTAVK